MSPNVAEVIEALPVDDRSSMAGSEIGPLLAQLGRRPVPTGRLNRLWILGTMEAKVAAGYLAWWIRSGFVSKDEKQRRLNETHLKAAIDVLGGMSYLRGLAIKVGQVLASYPAIIPEAFAEALGKLSFEAPPMHFSLLREHVRNQLGADPEELFASFDREAFAAASIGQVHRARLKTGEEVVVKIQYPNIGRTIQSDFRNFMAFTMPMRLSKDWDNIRAQWNDIREMLEWETDYEREAGFQERARAVFSDDDGIVVPRVFKDYCSKQVLTMEYLDGAHIEEYLGRNPSQEERDRFGALIMRASFRTAHAAKLWYADSNAGNYLFLRDGRLGLLDFGCCREFSKEEWDYYWGVVEGIQGEGDELRRIMIRAMDLDPDGPVDEAAVDFMIKSSRWHNQYLERDEVFDFGDSVALNEGIQMIGETAKRRLFRSLPVNTWLLRHLFGLRTMLFRLGARVNVFRIAREEGLDMLKSK